MQGISQFSAKDWHVIFLFSFQEQNNFQDTTENYLSCFKTFRLGIYLEERNQPDRKVYSLRNQLCVGNHT